MEKCLRSPIHIHGVHRGKLNITYFGTFNIVLITFLNYFTTKIRNVPAYLRGISEIRHANRMNKIVWLEKTFLGWNNKEMERVKNAVRMRFVRGIRDVQLSV